MSLTTILATTDYVSPDLVLAECRRLIGIPADQPVDVDAKSSDLGTWERLTSVPGGFESALYVEHHGGRPIPGYGDEDAIESGFVLKVGFDSAYQSDDSTMAFHRFLTNQLGGWFEAQGIGWTALDEYTLTWQVLTPCPL